MKKYLAPVFCILLLLLTACRNNTESSSEPSAGSEQAAEKTASPVELLVTIDQLRLRNAPGIEGQETGRLKEGSRLFEQGVVSDFTTRVNLRGVEYDDPWIKVKTFDGQTGWVYAGGVRVVAGMEQAYSRKLLAGRLSSFFGSVIADQVADYQTAYQSIQSSRDFASTYQSGVRLRDTIDRMLETRVTNIDPVNAPDLIWLEQAMPGFISRLVAEGTQASLFVNFKDWYVKAKQTKGTEDDRFVQIGFQIHPIDSIEYYFPAWFIQTWDYGGHSLLGQGIHKKIFDELEAARKDGDLFESEFEKTKTRLMDDITAQWMTYWEPADKIRDELDEIIRSDYSVLSKEDKIELANRRKMFEDFKSNNIQLNQRSGL